MKFDYSKDALRLLEGLEGLEIGGGAHNPFGLNTINLDRAVVGHNDCKQLELEMCGETLPVDVVALGDVLPFSHQAFDFVISSHVIEYFHDPVKAVREWCRVSRRYVFIICPHKERAGDEDRRAAETTLAEIRCRMTATHDSDDTPCHQTFWTHETFVGVVSGFLPAGWRLAFSRDPDDKVGNGFTVVFERRAQATFLARWSRATRRFTALKDRLAIGLDSRRSEPLSPPGDATPNTHSRSLHRHPESFLELAAIGSRFPPFRPTYDFPDDFINPSHSAIAGYPLLDGVIIEKRTGPLSDPIPGWLRQQDALKLYELAFFAEGDLLEFGCHHGLSTSILVQAAFDSGRRRTISTVDISPEATDATRRTLTALGLDRGVEILCEDAVQAARTLARSHRRFGLVFIDQDPGFRSVHDLCKELEALTVPGAFLLFHDFNDSRNADDASEEYDVFRATERGLAREKFELWGIYGCCGLFRKR